MLPWMIAYGNNRYGRWLPYFWAMLTTLPADQVAFLRTDKRGSNCTNLSTQQSMQHYILDQSEADTVIFSAYAILQESRYTVIDAADTNAYVAGAFISQQLPGMLCIKRQSSAVTW